MVVGALARGPSIFLNTVRIVASAGTIYAAFPGVMLLAAVYGYVVAGQRVRRWALALCLATLLAAVLFTIRFAIPRTAFFAYPAIYLLAAAGLSPHGTGNRELALPRRAFSSRRHDRSGTAGYSEPCSTRRLWGV